MTDYDIAKRGEVNEIRDRVTRLETKQNYSQETLRSLADRVDNGFSRISEQMEKINSCKSMLLTIGGGAGGGIAVALFALIKACLGY